MKNPCDTCFNLERQCADCEEREQWLSRIVTDRVNFLNGHTEEKELVAVGVKRKEDRSFTIQTSPAVLNYGNLINGQTTR